MPRIALIGDYNAAVTAHRAIPLALERAGREAATALEWSWIDTASIGTDVARQLARYAGVWCVPASPYANTAGALAAIRYAREHRRPFLGTCGGFQHALLEYAEACWGVAAAHAEIDPVSVDPVIAPLACALVEVTDELRIVPGTTLASIYGTTVVSEAYHCRYGLNPRYAARLADGPLRITARDSAGEVRAIQLEGHPFYHATLYQPERSALAERSHPLITAFAAAAAAASTDAAPTPTPRIRPSPESR
jgi:CTP synthase (UTP-ammonia lyase)